MCSTLTPLLPYLLLYPPVAGFTSVYACAMIFGLLLEEHVFPSPHVEKQQCVPVSTTSPT